MSYFYSEGRGRGENPAVHSPEKLMLVSGTWSAVSWQQLVLTQPAHRTPLGGSWSAPPAPLPALGTLQTSLNIVVPPTSP